MTLPDRARLFGDPSDSLVPEAVWMFREMHADWPLWDAAIEAIAELRECPTDEAEAQLLGAVAHDEVQARIEGADEASDPAHPAWFISIEESITDAIARRYMDVNMPRRHREDSL
jgi:hypothetical protein